MRVHAASESFAVTTIAGTRCVRFTFDGSRQSLCSSSGTFLGFNLRRTTSDDSASWLYSQYKNALECSPDGEDVDELAALFSDTHLLEANPEDGDGLPTIPPAVLNSPIQAFRWSDLAVEPGTAYTYTVITIYGVDDSRKAGSSVAVTVQTEGEAGEGVDEVVQKTGCDVVAHRSLPHCCRCISIEAWRVHRDTCVSLAQGPATNSLLRRVERYVFYLPYHDPEP